GGYGEAVNERRAAHEGTRIRIGRGGHLEGPSSGGVSSGVAELVVNAHREGSRSRSQSGKQGRDPRKRSALVAVAPGNRSVEFEALPEDRNSCSLKGAHQRGLLQLFGQVAILRSVPDHGCLEWQPVNLGSVGPAVEVVPTRIGAAVGAGCVI